MPRMDTSIKSVDAYIQMQDSAIQADLQSIRKTILDNAPEATESISYGMPAYKYNKKPLVYFCAFKKHIGFYAKPLAHEAFRTQLAAYKQGKGSVQFPLNQPIPYDIIAQIVKFRLKHL